MTGRSGATDEAGLFEAGRVAVEAVALMAGVSGGLGRDEGGAVGVGDGCSRGGPAGGVGVCFEANPSASAIWPCVIDRRWTLIPRSKPSGDISANGFSPGT